MYLPLALVRIKRDNSRKVISVLFGSVNASRNDDTHARVIIPVGDLYAQLLSI